MVDLLSISSCLIRLLLLLLRLHRLLHVCQTMTTLKTTPIAPITMFVQVPDKLYLSRRSPASAKS